MNQLYIDAKYVGIISNRLRNYQHKGSGKHSFTHSCERVDSHKRRGYFLPFKGKMIMKCHNCGLSTSLGKFIKELDPTLASEYRLELFKEGVFGDYKQPIEQIAEPVVEQKPKFDYFEGLINYKDISRTNPARLYLERRMIPTEMINRFYVAPRFFEWASRIDPVFKEFRQQVPRLILPVYGEQNRLLGFSCRSFGKELPKYIHLKVDKNREYIYGLDRVDKTKPIIVVEGQIDSLFLDNAVAVNGASYDSEFIEQNKQQVVIVPDNDFRRNKDVCAQIKKAIQNDCTVCFLPERWKKDINDIIKKDGLTKQELQQYIHTNKKTGTAALLELTLEKRC